MRITPGSIGHTDQLHQLFNTSLSLSTIDFRKGKADIFADSQVGKEGVVLKDHADSTSLGRHP